MSGGGPKADDSELTLVLIVGLFFVMCWGIWAFAKQPIVEGLRWVKWAEASVFQLIDPDLAKDRRLLETLRNDPQAIKALEAEADRVKHKLVSEDYTSRGLLAPRVLWDISNRIGTYTRWPIALVLMGAAIFFMFFSKKAYFKTAYDLEGLMKLQARLWPIITPILNFNPSEDNARNPGEEVPYVLPLFAEALSPEEWVAFNKIPVVNNVPDKEAMRRAFIAQLGPRWTGIGGLTPAMRCLFAAFALKGAQKRQESDDFLGKIALAWDSKTDFTPSAELMAEVAKIINNPKIGGEALKIADRFAYRTTALLGVLKWGRARGGVLAPATFLWLRGHDRALWYPLNNLGRRSYHAEAAGVMAHFMAEQDAHKPLVIPRFETALLTILQYWNDPIKHARTHNQIAVVPPLQSKDKKRG